MIRPDPGAGIFETILALEGRPVALEAHLERLALSAAALYGARLDASAGGPLATAARSLAGAHAAPGRIRILAEPAAPGEVSLQLGHEAAPSAFDGHLAAPVTLLPTVIEGGLGPHKWRDRSLIARRRAELAAGPSSQLLLTDAGGAVLETERANLVALVSGGLVSPPPDGRLLPGVTVRLTFAAAARLGVRAEFAPLGRADLEAAEAVLCASAVSGLVPARLEGPPPGGGRPGTTGGGGDVAAALAAALFESWRSG